MLIKRLPDHYKASPIAIIQQDIEKLSIANFKASITIFDDNEKVRNDYHNYQDNVMKLGSHYNCLRTIKCTPIYR